MAQNVAGMRRVRASIAGDAVKYSSRPYMAKNTTVTLHYP